jgi:acyl dehydratase
VTANAGTPADIVPGQELPRFTRTAGLAAWNRYAAVNHEFVPIHMDPEAGREAGYPGAIGMGFLQWSYLHNVLRAFVGGRGRIVRVACQFRAPALEGAVVTAGGTVRSVEASGDELRVELDLWARDESGRDLAPGSATVVFPA